MTLPPAPFRTPLWDTTRELTTLWRDWFRDVRAGLLRAVPERVVQTVLTAQAASVALTTAYTVPVTGWYRVSVAAKITQAASTSSSLTVGVQWVDTGTTLSETRPALTGNSLTTADSATWLIAADGGTTVQYETTYASVGATAMQYRVLVAVEAWT